MVKIQVVALAPGSVEIGSLSPNHQHRVLRDVLRLFGGSARSHQIGLDPWSQFAEQPGIGCPVAVGRDPGHKVVQSFRRAIGAPLRRLHGHGPRQ